MATVRFSKELIEQIERNARNKMSPPIERAKEQKRNGTWPLRQSVICPSIQVTHWPPTWMSPPLI